MKLNNKVIVVTGGGSGIGRELVFQLLGRGARVAAVDINDQTLRETAELAGEKGNHLSCHTVNIADRAAVEALPAAVIAAHGVIDGVINNAGIIQPFVRINELAYEAIERVMNVNFYGTVNMTKAFLPHLLERPEAHIANVSSIGGFLPVPGQTIYGAAKAAVKLFTEGLHSELLETNVRVTIIFPGAVATNITTNSGVEISRPAGTGEETESRIKPMPAPKAAEIILDGLERNRYRVLVGSDARLMDALTRTAPKFAANFIYKQMKELL